MVNTKEWSPISDLQECVCVCLCVCDAKLVNTKSQCQYIGYMSYRGTLIAHGP